MGLDYHKHKKGRILNRGSSPRDLQNRRTTSNDNSDSYLELLTQFATLKAELEEVKRASADTSLATSTFTDEEFNEALEKALLKEITSIEKQYESQLREKDVVIQSLESTIKTKDETITTLQQTLETMSNSKVVVTNTSVETPTVEEDRPTIQEEIIDPSEETELESHITIESVVEENTDIEAMSNKLSKLKDILG